VQNLVEVLVAVRHHQGVIDRVLDVSSETPCFLAVERISTPIIVSRKSLRSPATAYFRRTATPYYLRTQSLAARTRRKV
jgi:hypothetical protein